MGTIQKDKNLRFVLAKSIKMLSLSIVIALSACGTQNNKVVKEELKTQAQQPQTKQEQPTISSQRSDISTKNKNISTLKTEEKLSAQQEAIRATMPYRDTQVLTDPLQQHDVSIKNKDKDNSALKAEKELIAQQKAIQATMSYRDAYVLTEEHKLKLQQKKQQKKQRQLAQLQRKRAKEALATPSVIPAHISEGEKYQNTTDNPVTLTANVPVSTFSIDVDTGSYSNMRRMINQGYLPLQNAIRPEEFINYFSYNYPQPKNNSPFSVNTELSTAPWHHNRHILKIGLQGYELERSELKAANLVFLLDVSGSMDERAKLPLLKQSLIMLSKQLTKKDKVSIVVYAGASGLVLDSASGDQLNEISTALSQLRAGGSTNGHSGIELAYQMAEKNFIEGGVNRVILATDGDFNVGISNIKRLKKLIEKKRKTGIALTTLGFGEGNYNEHLMEQLANVGNGNHAYIDTINEARKVLVDEMSSTMQIIAKDVKIQVEFNPNMVKEYRLIGYQNRLLKREDFNNDKVDAGEIGAGHTVTAIYELSLHDSANPQIDDLRYGKKETKTKAEFDNELAFVKLRYKQPEGNKSKLIQQAITLNSNKTSDDASQDMHFASAVAGFAQLLSGSKYNQDMSFDDVIKIAQANKGKDEFGYRSEFIQLVRTADALNQ